MNPTPLGGRVAVVTGGGNGIGRACVLQLAALGARVAILDMGCDPSGLGDSTEPAEEVAREARRLGGEAIAVYADVANRDQVAAAMETIRSSLGAPSIAVIAAGIMRNRMIFNMSDAEWLDVLNVHLYGTVNVVDAVLPAMQATGYGRVVTFTSSAGLFGVTGASNYASAKAAIEMLTRTAAIEQSRHGVLFNMISPH
ncbi:MAG TPA: SDR family NAD(P)-dependent oxidoreductase, partial [Casimicrobiaceae bacterium]